MGRMLLQDTMTVRLSLNEDNGSGKMTATGVFGRVDVPTANNRIYPRSLWEREVKRMQKPISERKVLSEVDHPQDGKTKLSRTAGMLTALSINEDGDIIGTMEVLDTASGKDLKALIDGGASVGVSSRGYGSVKLNNEGKDVVQDDFQCQTFDFVADPAHQMAYPEFSTGAATDAKAEESKVAVKGSLTETNPQVGANIQEMDVQVDSEKKPDGEEDSDGKSDADKKGDEVVVSKEAEGEPEAKSDKDDDDSEENSEPKKLMDAETQQEGRFQISLIKYPSGTYGFVGSDIPVELSWVKKDGSALSDEEAKEVRTSSNPGMMAKSVSFKTVADALKAAEAAGIKKSDVAVKEAEDEKKPVCEPDAEDEKLISQEEDVELFDESDKDWLDREVKNPATGNLVKVRSLPKDEREKHRPAASAERKKARDVAKQAKQADTKSKNIAATQHDTAVQLSKARTAALRAKASEDVAQESADLEQMKKDFELRLVAAVKESEAAIRAQLIAEMEADSGLAGAKLALERTKEILAPYVLPKDVETEMVKRDSKIIEQAKMIESLKSKNRQFEAVCKDMGFSLYLERKLAKHPKFGEIKIGLGDLTKMESLDALKARVRIYEQELPKIQESWKAGRRATVEDYETRIEGLVEELAAAQTQIRKVTEERIALGKERDEAVQIGLDSASQAYLEQRISGMPEAPGIRKTFRLLECKTKEKIDTLVEGYENSRRSSGSDFTQIRKRLGGRVPANLVQESLEGTLIEHSRFEIENKEVDSLEVVDGVRVSMDEIRKLSGMSLK